jgi:nicotinamidase/pyrazinamidase
MKPASDALGPDDALLLVDVQEDFCPGGALAIDGGDGVVPVLNRWIDAACERGIPIYASRDWHPRRHPSFRDQGGPWPPHCIQGTAGAELHAKLAVPADAVAIVKGTRLDRDQYSAFDETGLAKQLARDGVRRLWVGGLALDVCVAATVRDALAAGFEVHVLVAGTRPVSPAVGAETLRELEAAGAILEEST